MSLESMTAAVLAGGLGTRLRSVVSDKPKVLADVGGRPFLEYLLDQLAREGVRSVVLCTGYMGDQIQNRFGTAYNKMALRYSREPHPLGTGGALRLALPMLQSDTVLVLNGDSYYGAKLDEFSMWHAERRSHATILLAQTEDTRRYGRVQTGDAGRILQFLEKADTQGPGWINAGIYLLRRQMIESIETGRAVSIEREVFPGWIGKGLHGFRSEGRLWDIGVPSAYAQANVEFVSNFFEINGPHVRGEKLP
jgi:D-glycero-alpha-D-manno-heptose 1-phosphate guanylyltransferase